MPHVRPSVRGLKTMGDPDFLPRNAQHPACAAFIEESRMNFANAIKVRRKSGGSPTTALSIMPNASHAAQNRVPQGRLNLAQDVVLGYRFENEKSRRDDWKYPVALSRRTLIFLSESRTTYR